MPPVVINTFSLSCFRYCYWCVLYCVSVQSASIFVSHFLRLRHQTPTGALTLYPAGDFRPPEFPQTSLLFHRSKFLATPPLAHIILFILQHCTQCDVHKITFSASDRPRHIRLHYNFQSGLSMYNCCNHCSEKISQNELLNNVRLRMSKCYLRNPTVIEPECVPELRSSRCERSPLLACYCAEKKIYMEHLKQK